MLPSGLSPSDAVGQLIGQTAVMLSGSHSPSPVAQHLANLVDYGDKASYAVVPLCFVALIVLEHYRAIAEGGNFRFTHVLAKLVAVVFCLVAYSQICRVITHVAGAGGGWMTSTQYDSLSDFDQSNAALGDAWQRWGDLKNVFKFIGIVVIWIVVMMAALFAFVAGQLLALLQACYLSLLLGVGKLCIAFTLLPNVRLGWSWAKSLAQVSAWSLVAALITGLLGTHVVVIRELMVAGDMMPLLKTSAHFVVFGLLMLSVPVLVSNVWGGVAPGLAAAALPFAAAVGLARRGVGAATTTAKASYKGAKDAYQATKEAAGVVRNATGGRMVQDFLKVAAPVRPEPQPSSKQPMAIGDTIDGPTPVASPREQLLRRLKEGDAADEPTAPVRVAAARPAPASPAATKAAEPSVKS